MPLNDCETTKFANWSNETKRAVIAPSGLIDECVLKKNIQFYN